jgi:hypothetical protein
MFIALLLVMTAISSESLLTSNDIERLIESKWNDNSLSPSKKTSDEEFIRRLYLDLTGRIPTAEEVKSFLENKSPDKRSKKIDELLNSEEFGRFMADVWMQILFSYDGKRKVPPAVYKLIKDELSSHFNQNQPYNSFVYKLISANGFVSSNPYVLYSGRFETPEDAAGTTMKVFMGKQIQCAQCHKHPFENISQEDFYGVAAFFARKQALPLLQKDQAQKITKFVTRMEKVISKARDKEMEMNVESSEEMNSEMQNMPEHENVKPKKNKNPDKSNKNKKKKYNIPPQWAVDSLKQRMQNPVFTPDLLVWDAVNGQIEYEKKGEKKTVFPKYLGGASESPNAGVERRTLLANFLTTTESKQLAKAFVNRFWKHFFGYGFINPVDDFTESDPGTNPGLLDKLAEEFLRSNFDVKELFRLITNTDAYQLSSTPNSTNKDDHEYFSRAVLRPLTPIQLTNSILSTSGYLKLKGLQNKSDEEIEKIRLRILQLFVYTFEDDEMNESENFSGTITQALMMMNSDLAEKVSEKKPGNVISQVLSRINNESERIDYLYLNSLSRYPTKSERTKLLSEAAEDEKFYEDLQWALINSSEFIFNH